MDENILKGLEESLSSSPDNVALRFMLVQGYFTNSDFQKALEVLNSASPDVIQKEQDLLLAAKVCIANDQGVQALQYLNSDAAEFQLQKARAYFQLNDLEEARKAYLLAIKDNKTLEDTELSAKLELENVVVGQPERVKLRVISNDDTDDIEVSRILEPRATKVTFADVGGLEQVKKQIRKKIITPFQKPSLFERFKKKIGGGILLYGPPGCGKTLLARATAGECNASFYNVSISDILDMYIGESERKLHAIFQQARENTPAVIFFDEIEALAAKRQHSREATSAKLVSQFLSELDGFSQNNEGVLILGATNVPWALDPAFRRPGRFDRVVFIAPPDHAARLEIIKQLMHSRPSESALDFEKLAKATSGFSGADLMNLVETAVDEAIDESILKESEVPVSKKHLEQALSDVKPTTLEWLTMARNYAKYANDAGQYNDVLDFLKKHGKS